MTWSQVRLRQWLTQLELGTGIHSTPAQARLRLGALRGLCNVSTADLGDEWHEHVLWPLANLVERMMQLGEVAPDDRLAAFSRVLEFSDANNGVWHRLELAACMGLWEALGRAAQRSGPAREALCAALIEACRRAVESGDELSLDHAIAALRGIDHPSSTELLHAIATRNIPDRQRAEVGRLLTARTRGHSQA